jgi:hypothetical protein
VKKKKKKGNTRIIAQDLFAAIHNIVNWEHLIPAFPSQFERAVQRLTMRKVLYNLRESRHKRDWFICECCACLFVFFLELRQIVAARWLSNIKKRQIPKYLLVARRQAPIIYVPPAFIKRIIGRISRHISQILGNTVDGAFVRGVRGFHRETNKIARGSIVARFF